MQRNRRAIYVICVTNCQCSWYGKPDGRTKRKSGAFAPPTLVTNQNVDVISRRAANAAAP